MRSFFFVPPLNKISGGLVVICQLADILHQAGHAVALVVRETDPARKAAVESMGVPVIDWEALELKPEDLWVVPEGWPNALAPGLNAGARNLVYVQNWAYLFSALPEGVSWQQLPVRFLAVSTPVARFIREHLNAPAEILRPGVDLELFCPNPQGGNTLLFKNPDKPFKKINVAWMPRKNKAIAIQAMQIVEARAKTRLPVNWVEIHGARPDRVAELLQMSHIFMGTGFPEGFGLPPLEAMACGAVAVTSAGQGGWDYLRQALPPLPELAHLPGFSPPGYYLQAGDCGELDLPAGANAFVVPDADPISLAIAVEHAANLIAARAPLVQEMVNNGLATALALGSQAQREHTLALWQKFSRE